MPDALQKATEALRNSAVYNGDSPMPIPDEAAARIVLDAAGVQGLVEALEKWKCQFLHESNVENEDGTYDVIWPHPESCYCNGTGLHPIASEALSRYRGDM